MIAWKRLLKENFKWPSALIYAVSFLLVYFIRPESIQNIPEFTAYFSFIKANIPGIRKYVDVSHMPDLASVYFPIMALISPILILQVWRTQPSPEIWATAFWHRPVKNCALLIFIGLIATGAFWITYIKGGTEISSFSVRDSKLWLAIFGPIYAGSGAWGTLGVFTRGFFSLFTMEGHK